MPVNSEIFRIYRHLFYGSPLQVSPERIGMKRKAADEKEEERGRNDRPGNLSPAMKGKRIFQTPAQAGDAESKPGHGSGETAKP